MRDPKFRVSEEVLFLSHKERPGEWLSGVITDFQYAKAWKPANAPERGIINDVFIYHIDNRGTAAAEFDLRKRHDPGADSFTDLMTKLNSPVKEPTP